MKHRRTRHRREWLLRVGVLLLVLLGAVAAIDHQLRPMVQSFATYQIKSFATEVIDAAILDYLGKEGVTYDTFSTVTRDDSSQVTGISLNTVNVNLFKAGITDRINSEMSQIGLQTIKIPVGSLLGTQILQGVGPDITLRVQPSSYAACSVDSQFDAAGINQTRHRVVLKVSVMLSAIIPGYVTQTELNVGYTLAEAIIVGATPDQFTHVTGDDSSLIGKINDYTK